MDVEVPYGIHVHLERECGNGLSPPARRVNMLFGSNRTHEREPSGFREQLMLLLVCTAASFTLVDGSVVSVSCPNGLSVRLDIWDTAYVVTIPNGADISTSPTGRFSSHSPSYQNLLREGHQVTVPVDTRDFSGMETLVQRRLSQSMAADLDRMALGGTSSDTAPQDRTPRSRESLYDSLRYLLLSSAQVRHDASGYFFLSSETTAEDSVAMEESLLEAASCVRALQDESDDLCITQGRRRIRIRRK